LRLASSIRPPVVGRLLAVAILLILASIGYVLLLQHLHVSEVPQERHLGAGKAGPAQIYVWATGIDPLNYALQLHVSFAPGPGLEGQRPMAADRDLTLLISHGGTTDQVDIQANRPVPEADIEVDLDDGDVADYPFDRYTAGVHIQCIDKALQQAGKGGPLANGVTVWEGLWGFSLHAVELPDSRPEDVRLRLTIHRSPAFAFFALATYGAMVVLALGVLVISVMTFAGLRAVEATLVGALCAIVFALPVLRNVLPGAPPLGVRADTFVFLWAELAVVFSLVLMILAWARSGARPH
jgi:hypothetical protein